MDRCAVLVDAGYLLGAAGTILAADRSRAALLVDHAGLVAAIVDEVQLDMSARLSIRTTLPDDSSTPPTAGPPEAAQATLVHQHVRQATSLVAEEGTR